MLAIEAQNEEVIGVLNEILVHLLGMEVIHATDNFFEIGGDSITAIQFVSRVRKAGYQLEVVSVSESATIADIAASCVATNEHEVHSNSADQQFIASGFDDQQLTDFLNNFD